MYGLPAAGAGTAEAKECTMVSLGRVDVCVPISTKETCGTLMFAEYEATFAAFSRFSSQLSMFCKVLARDCKVVLGSVSFTVSQTMEGNETKEFNFPPLEKTPPVLTGPLW